MLDESAALSDNEFGPFRKQTTSLPPPRHEPAPTMKPVLQNWTLVLAGGWNVSIFQPQWVAKHVFQQDDIVVEVAMATGPPGLVFLSNHVSLAARSDRLVFGCKNTTDETLAALEVAALRVLELLPHTPLTAFGINFGFVEENPSNELVRLFETADLTQISDFGCEIAKTTISRQLRIEDKILNLSQTLEAGQVHIFFNFHFEVPDAGAARAKLVNVVIPCRDLTSRLLTEIHTVE